MARSLPVQVIRPGAPMIYSGIGHIMNMRYIRISLGSSELPLRNADIIALAHHYDLPGYNATGRTDSGVPPKWWSRGKGCILE